MSVTRYYKDQQAPFPLDPKSIITRVVLIEQREIRGKGFVTYLKEGIRGGGLEQTGEFVDTTQSESNDRLTELCGKYECLGYSAQNSTNGFPQRDETMPNTDNNQEGVKNDSFY